MGYGGFFKTVVKVAATAFGAWACGPPCAAIGSAVATGATGGSFKESLMAGATTFATASFAQGLSSQIGTTAAESAASQAVNSGLIPSFDTAYQIAADTASGFGPATFASVGADMAAGLGSGVGAGLGATAAEQAVADSILAQQQAAGSLLQDPSGLGSVLAKGGGFAPVNDTLTQGFVDAGIGGADPFLGATALDLTTTPIDEIPGVGDVSKFIKSEFGTVGGTPRTGFDIVSAANKAGDTLRDLGFTSAQAAGTGLNTAGDLLSAGVGGILDMTLSQALNSDLPEVDAMLATKWSPEQILALKNEARNALSQSAFDRLTGVDGGVANPFGGTPEGLEEFESVIARGIENQNIALGPATATDITASFANPNFGTNILNQEQLARINTSGLNINEAFPGGAFGDLDQGIIDSIVDERIGPAQGQISKFGARGNLNVTGGQTANEFIQRQVPKAQERVGEIGTGILGGSQGELNTIRDRARQEAGGYQLGDDLFDVTPFAEQRQGLIEERQGTLGSDIRTSLGSEPLFDVSGALQSAGRAQGVVSGQGGNQAFLDSIAARESGAFGGRTNRRGLSSRGSGAF